MKKITRLLALFLALVMVATSAPADVWATESAEIEVEDVKETEKEEIEDKVDITQDNASETANTEEATGDFDITEIVNPENINLANVYEGELTSEDRRGKSELGKQLAAVEAATAGVNYVENEVIMTAKSEEEAELAAKAYSKATGYRVYVKSYGQEVAVLGIDTSSFEILKKSGIQTGALSFDSEIMSDNPVITLMGLGSQSNNNLPPVFQNGIYELDSVSSSLIVDTTNEHKDFKDPMLGKNGETSTPETYNKDKYQWYHEVVNDKFVWNEMDKLTKEGTDYNGALRYVSDEDNFNTNLANLTIAVIDTGLNDKHEEWVNGGNSPVVDGKSFVNINYMIIPKDKPTEEEELWPDEKPASICIPSFSKTGRDCIYPSEKPVWKYEPDIPTSFAEKNRDKSEEELKEAWKAAWASDGWKECWELVWNDDSLDFPTLYSMLWFLGGEDGWKRAWELMLDDNCMDGSNPGWQKAYRNVNKNYTEITDQNGYQDENNNYGGGHGSNVAGIVASPRNEIGGRGVAAGAKVMPLKVFGPNVDAGQKKDFNTDGLLYQFASAKGEESEVVEKYKNNDEDFYYRSTSGTDEAIIRAINYARYHSHRYFVDKPDGDDGSDYAKTPDGDIITYDDYVRVINMSLGGPVYNYLDEQAVNKAIESNILVFVSAGNYNSMMKMYPADFDKVINVASLNAEYGKSSFSNHGSGIDLGAPGGDMYPDAQFYDYFDGEKCYYYDLYNWSCGSGKFNREIEDNLSEAKNSANLDFNTYSNQHGTSQASPVAAGVGALVAAQYPDMDAYQLKQLLINSAYPIKTGYQYVNNCVDAAAALGIDDSLSNAVATTYSYYAPSADPQPVDASVMPYNGTIVMDLPGTTHEVFYYTVDGKEPLVNDEAGTDDSTTYKSYDGVVNLEDFVNKNLITGKGTLNFKYKVLLYGSVSQTYTVKITFDTPVTSSISIRPKDNRPGYTFDFDDGSKLAGMKLGMGSKLQLTADFYPVGAATNNIFWESSDTSLVTVDQNGTVTAKYSAVRADDTADGAIITATALDGSGAVGEYYINVVLPLSGIEFRPNKKVVISYDDDKEEYNSFQLCSFEDYGAGRNIYTIPENANSSMFYTSANPKVATVDETGNITGVAVGKTYITVKSAENPKLTLKIDVEVRKYVQAKTYPEVYLFSGQKSKLPFDSAYNKNNEDYEWFIEQCEGNNCYYLNGPDKNKAPEIKDYFTLDKDTGVITVNRTLNNDSNKQYAASFLVGARIKDKNAGTYDGPVYYSRLFIYPLTTKINLTNTSKTLAYNYGGLGDIDINDYIASVEPGLGDGSNPFETFTYNKLSIKSSNPAIMEVTDAENLKLVMKKTGKVTVTITAEDSSKKSAKITFDIKDARANVLGISDKKYNRILTPSNSLNYIYNTNSNSKNFLTDKEIQDYLRSLDDGDAALNDYLAAKNDNFVVSFTNNYETIDCIKLDSKTGTIKPTAKLKDFKVQDEITDPDARNKARELRVTGYKYIWNWSSGKKEYIPVKGAYEDFFYIYSSATKKITPLIYDKPEGADKGQYITAPKGGIVLNGIGSAGYLYPKAEPEGSYAYCTDTDDYYNYSGSFTYTTGNTNVCTVSDNGTITATGSGSTNVTIMAKDGSNVKATVKVTVIQPVTELNIVSATGDFAVARGKNLKLTANTNQTATNKKVTWKLYSEINAEADDAHKFDWNTPIDKKNIASVSNGTVSIGKECDLTYLYVVAEAADGSGTYCYKKIDIYGVTTSVVAQINTGEGQYETVKDITLFKSYVEGSAMKWYEYIYPTSEPAEAFNANYAVKSSNEKVATAYIKEGIVYVDAINKGKCSVKITALDGSNKSATVNVTVLNPVKGITLSTKTGKRSVAAGGSLQMVASTNSDASNKKMNWEITKLINHPGSDDEIEVSAEDISKYVSISTAGAIKAVKGTTDMMAITVKASATDGSQKTAEMIVYLNQKVSRVFVYTAASRDKEMEILPNTKTQFYAVCNDDACNTKIDWYVDAIGEEEGTFKPKDYKITISNKGLLTIPNNDDLYGKTFVVRAVSNDEGSSQNVLIRITDGSKILCYRDTIEKSFSEQEINYGKKYTYKFVAVDKMGKVIPDANISISFEGDDIFDTDNTAVLGSKITFVGKKEGTAKLIASCEGIPGYEKTVNIYFKGDGSNQPSVNDQGLHDPVVKLSNPYDLNYSNDNSEILRFCVWIETDFDTDGDGKNDLVKAFLQVPRMAVENNCQVPIIYDPTPYAAGTVIDNGNEAKIRKGWNPEDRLDKHQDPRATEGLVPLNTLDVSKEAKQETWFYKLPTDGLVLSDVDYGYDGAQNYDYFLERGYAVCQCCGIGTYDSEGYELCGTELEAKSHAAVVEWLGGKDDRHAFTDKSCKKLVQLPTLEWSNGNVAMTGCSYGGTIPFEVATLKPQGLKTIVPFAGIANWYDYTNSQGVAKSYSSYTQSLAYLNSGRYFNNFDGKEDIMKRYMTWTGSLDMNQTIANGDFTDAWSDKDYSLKDMTGNDISALIVSGLNDYNVATKQADLMFRSFENSNLDVHMILHQDGHRDLGGLKVAGKNAMQILDSWYIYYLDPDNKDKAKSYLYGADGVFGAGGEYKVLAQRNDMDDDGTTNWVKYKNWAKCTPDKRGFTFDDEAAGTFESWNNLEGNKTISTKEEYSELYESFVKYASKDNVGQMLLDAADKHGVIYNLGDSQGVKLAGVPTLELKLKFNADESTKLASLIDNYENDGIPYPDGMMVTTYLIDVAEDGSEFDAYLPLYNSTSSEVKTETIDGFSVMKREKTSAKIVSYGWTDLNNPNGGYYSDDDAYKSRQTLDLDNGDTYNIFMNATCYNVPEGHQLKLIVLAYDPRITSLESLSYIKDTDGNKHEVNEGSADYSFTIVNDENNHLSLPVVKQ